MKLSQRKLAFSLIELSVVILIIGILVIGITRGSRIISAAKLSSARSLSKNSPVTTNAHEIALWFDATNEKSFKENETVNGAVITTWYDVNPMTSTPLDLVNSASPIYVKSATNGLPAIRFNSTPINRTNVYGKDLTKGDQITIFLVQKNYPNFVDNASPVHWGGAYTILMHVLNAGANLISDFGGQGANARMWFNPPSSFNNRTNIVVSTRRSGGVGFMKINGTEVYRSPTLLTSTVPGSAVGTFSIGQDGMRSDINEIIIFRSALNDQEISEIEKYLSAKWGVALKPLS